MEKKFETAVRNKVRFSSKMGLINVEDLWDLTVEQLDSMFKILKKTQMENSESSLLSKVNKIDVEVSLKLDIIEYIVRTKLTEAETKENEAIRRNKANQIKELIAKKKTDELGEKSVDELMQMLNELA